MKRGAAEGRYRRWYLNRRWWRRHADTVANIRILARKIPEIIFVIDITFRKKEHLKVIDGLRNLAPRAILVFKDKTDGSDAISAYIKKNRLINFQLVVCGMNTDACVLKTARNLALSALKHRYSGRCLLGCLYLKIKQIT